MSGSHSSRRALRRRTMMVRSLLHGVSTSAAIFAMRLAHNAPMWVQMTLYGASWVACAAMYVPIQYLREQLVDFMDERTRRILREELDRRDLLVFQRRIDRVGEHHEGVPRDDSRDPPSKI